MKNRVMISVLCICILLTVSGCGNGVENEMPSDENMESTVSTESNQEEQTGSNDHYEEMIADTEESEDCVPSSVMPVSESDTDIESETPSEEDMEQDALTESDQEEQTGPRDYYAELIADARECIEGKVEEDPEEYYDFSYIIYWYGAYYGASMR